MSRGTSIKPREPCEKCGKPSMAGMTLCSTCAPHNVKHFRKAMYQFKSSALQTAFEMMLRADDRLSLDAELALMRTCLQGVVQKCEAKDPSELGPHAVAAITSLASEVARTCEIVARLEQRYSTHVPLETLLFFVQLIAETLTKQVGEDEAESLVSAILELPLPMGGVYGPENSELFKRATLARGTTDNGTTTRGTLSSMVGDRQARIDELRRDAQQLREQIKRSEVQSDDQLAPSEPTDEGGEA